MGQRKKQHWRAGNMLYPLPAVMVSCGREGEKPNIITVAWVGTVCSDPAMVSISVRPNRYSYDIIRETGEFVINLTTKELARATDYCGVRSGRGCGQVRKDAPDSGKSGAPSVCAHHRGESGKHRVTGHRGERTGNSSHVPGGGSGRYGGRSLPE